MKNSHLRNHFIILSLFVFTLLSTLSVFAGPGKTTYQAKIVKPDGYPLEAASVNFKFTILDPAGSCILYAETYSSVNMSGTGGLISFALGSGVKTYPASATTFEQVFSNITPTLSCDAGGPPSYSPLVSDSRKIVMQFHDGSGWQTLPAMSINAVPYAMYANEATKLNGLTSSDFVQLSTVPTCAASEALRYTGAGFTCVAVGNSVTSGTVVTALGYTPADGVSVTALSSTLTTTNANVSSVSSTVFSVSSTVTSLQNSVAASFAAITSSQWTTSGTNIFYNTGNIGIGTTTPVTKLDVSGGVRIGAESTTCAPALAGTLRYIATSVEYCNGTSWQAFGVSGSGITNFNGSTSGTQLFATGTGGTAPNFATANGVHTLNLPLANTGSVTAGLISNTDYTTFTNKITSSAASIAQVLGYIPADNAVSGTYAQKANNLSDLTNVVTARTNLGLGTFATASSIDLGSASATGTLAIARLPSFTGDATITAASNTIILSNSGVTAGTYTKVTVDNKGRVTSGAQIISSDVTTALGYTPANSATIVSSQWSTSGTTINYMPGNVGIGMSAPTSPLDVAVTDTSSGVILTNTNSTVSRYPIIGVVNYAGSTTGHPVLSMSNALGTSDTPAAINSGMNLGTLLWTGRITASQTMQGARIDAIAEANFGVNTAPTRLTFSVAPSSGSYVQRMVINSMGNVGIGITTPTAKLHLAAGTSSTAGLKFTSGTLLTSPESGTMEYDGFNFYVTDSTNTRRTIATGSSSGTIDNASNINSSGNITLTPTGSVIVSSTTASTNSSTGALIVKGGAGIAGNLNVAGTISGSAKVAATGFRANQGVPDAADSSTNGYAFGQDGDTGLFSPGSGAANGVLAFYGNNLELMRVTASGAVGIGTTTPSWKLQIRDQYPYLAFQDTDNASGSIGTITYNQDGNFYFDADNPNTGMDSGYRFRANGGTKYLMSITNGGNVGVGTTAPATKMDVVGTLGLYGGTLNGDSLQRTVIYSDDVNHLLVESPTVSSTRLNTYFSNRGYGAGGSRMMINGDSGNIGIGTSAPTTRLEVNGIATISGSNDLVMKASAEDAGDLIFRTSSGTQKGRVWSESGVGLTGLYLSSGDNTPDVHISDLGNVGIGTTNPGALLDVAGNVRMSGAGPELEMNAGGPRLRVPAGNTLAIHTGGGFGATANERMRIDAAGNVGIGTTTPSTLNGWARVLDVYAPNHSKIVATQAQSGVSVTVGIYSHGLVGNGYAGYPQGYGGVGLVGTETNNDVGLMTSNTTRMAITKDGSVGINITAPAYMLDVNGATLIRGGAAHSVAAPSYGGTYFSFNGATNTAGLWATNASTSQFAFYTKASGADPGTERMRITDIGRVGIGTASPSENLHVVGNLRVQGSTDCTLGNGAGGTNCSSDARLKENIKPIPYALEKIASLKGVEFDWNIKSVSYGRHDIGVIAQDVEKVFPSAVIDDKNTGYKKVDYAVLVAPLIQAVKDLYNMLLGEKEYNIQQDRQIAQTENTVRKLAHENQELKAENAEKSKQLNEIRTYLCAKDPKAPMCK